MQCASCFLILLCLHYFSDIKVFDCGLESKLFVHRICSCSFKPSLYARKCVICSLPRYLGENRKLFLVVERAVFSCLLSFEILQNFHANYVTIP